MSAPQKRQQVFPPAKGSFPIDHFQGKLQNIFEKNKLDKIYQIQPCKNAMKAMMIT